MDYNSKGMKEWLIALLIDSVFYSEDILLPFNELGRGIENNIIALALYLFYVYFVLLVEHS